MKKKLSVLLVVIMVMMLGMTSYAAKSPTTDTTPKPEDTLAPEYGNVSISPGSVIVNGIVVQKVPGIKPATQSKVNEAQKEAEKLISSTSKVLQVIEIDLFTDDFVKDVQNLVGIDITNQSYDTITITFDVDGVVAGQKLALLVQKMDGTWVVVYPDKVENGKVTATFDFFFKAIAFVAYNASAQTGDMTAVLPVAMGACAVAMGICGKKIKKNK